MGFEEFLLKSPVFYGRPDSEGRQEKNLLEEVEGFDRHRGEYCTTYFCRGHSIPSQGWKVHLSAAPDNVDTGVAVAARVSSELEVHFKVVNTASQYLIANSKNSERLSAGKLVTLYPTKEKFEPLVSILDKELRGCEGPEVLTDLPGESQCVHFRYGAFVPIRSDTGEFSIVNGHGQLIPDPRGILTAEEFNSGGIATIERAIERLRSDGVLDIKHARLVKQSNAGGIFQCSYEDKPCYLKLGRWKAGIDRNGADGWTRVKREFAVLNRLKGSGFTPSPVALLKKERTVAAITADLEAPNLQAFKRTNFPIYGADSGGWVDYLEQVLRICIQLKSVIETMHSEGIFHRDLHCRNILYDGSTIKIVDFEDAVYGKSEAPGNSKAQGYSSPWLANSYEADWYAFRQVVQDLVFGNTAVNQFNLGGWDRRWVNPYPSLLREREAVRALEVLEDLAWSEGTFTDSRLYPRIQGSSAESVDLTEWFRSARSRQDECTREMGGLSLAPYSREKANSFVYGTTAISGVIQVQESCGLSGVSGRLAAGLAELSSLRPECGRGSNGAGEVRQDLLKPEPLWNSAVLQYLLALSATVESEEDRRFAEKCIYRIIEEDWAANFGPPLATNSNRWEDQRTGLLAGPLGLAWVMSVWIGHCSLNESMMLDYIRHTFRRELETYEIAGNGGLFAVQGSRLLPYLATGSAGFGVVLTQLRKFRRELRFDGQAEQLLAATNAEFSICGGLLNGMAGLALGQLGLQRFLETERASSDDLIKRIQRLLPLDRMGPVFLDDAGLRYTFDFAEGAAGVLFAVQYLSGHRRECP